MKKILQNGLLVLGVILFFIVVLFIQGIASSLGSYVARKFTYEPIDPSDIFAGYYVHHIVQMLVAILIIVILKIIFKKDFGFKVGDAKKGLTYIMIFMSLAGFLLFQNIYIFSTTPRVYFGYPMNTRNIIGQLSFQLFMSGPSEEILFRALPITFFLIVFKKSVKIKWGLTLEVIIAALLFAFAHFDTFSLFPFQISKVDFQIYYAFFLGIFYGITYQKTGSIYYPMIMHSISNVLSVGISYLLYFIY